MYDMTRVSGNGYYDSDDKEETRHATRESLSKQRLSDPMAMAGGVIDPLPDDAPQFVKDYYDYYKTPRGYNERSGNSTDGWRTIGTLGYSNSRFLYYINEIRSAVLVMHGEKAHSRYFGEAAYKYMVEGKAEGYNFIGKPNPNPANKQLLIIPGASHCDLYDGGYTELKGKGQPKNMIPWDKLADFFKENLKSEEEDTMSDLISIDQFDEVVIKIGQVKEAEKIEKSDKLLKLQVDIGEEKPRQIVAGLAKFYSPEELVDRKVCVVANLQPAKLFGTLSEGMILATGKSGALLSPDEAGEVGERIQ